MQAPQQEIDLSPDVLFETLFSLASSRTLSAGVQLALQERDELARVLTRVRA